jgi:hypothetical protein
VRSFFSTEGPYMRRSPGKRELEIVLAILIFLALVVGSLIIAMGTP